MGIEALSRGAKKVVFNDLSKESINLLKKNIEKCKIEEQVEIKNRDAVTFLQTSTEKFDYVYIDPPYSTDLGQKALENVANCLTEEGIAIFEDEREFDKQISGLTVCDKRKYGRAYLTFFKKEN